jgi:hypothetical protein
MGDLTGGIIGRSAMDGWQSATSIFNRRAAPVGRDTFAEADATMRCCSVGVQPVTISVAGCTTVCKPMFGF